MATTHLTAHEATQPEPLEPIMNVKSLVTAATLVAAAFGVTAAPADDYAANQNYPATNAASLPRIAQRVVRVDEFQRNQLPAANGLESPQRAQIVAEAREARRLGLISEGEAAAPAPTTSQQARVHHAGIDAMQQQVAAK